MTGFCDRCHNYTTLTHRQDGAVLFVLCARCNFKMKTEPSSPGPLLIGLIIAAVVVSLLAFAYSLLPRW